MTRPRPWTPLEIKASEMLGATPQQVSACLQSSSLEEANNKLAGIKREAKKLYRKFSLELHPDRTGGDQEKADLFMALTLVNDQLQDLKIQQRPIQAQPVVRIYTNGTSVVWNTSTNTNSTTGSW